MLSTRVKKGSPLHSIWGKSPTPASKWLYDAWLKCLYYSHLRDSKHPFLYNFNAVSRAQSSVFQLVTQPCVAHLRCLGSAVNNHGDTRPAPAPLKDGLHWFVPRELLICQLNEFVENLQLRSNPPQHRRRFYFPTNLCSTSCTCNTIHPNILSPNNYIHHIRMHFAIPENSGHAESCGTI